MKREIKKECVRRNETIYFSLGDGQREKTKPEEKDGLRRVTKKCPKTNGE
jgi:hypothetical protein